MALVDVNTLAALFELTARRIQQLANNGTIPRAERGQYDLALSVRGYIRALKAAAERGKRGSDPMQAAKLRHETARAAMIEIELAQKRGDLIVIADVMKLVTDDYARVRARLLAIPSKMAPMVAMVANPEECKAILEDAIFEVLTELTRDADPDIARSVEESRTSETDSKSDSIPPASKASGEPVGRHSAKAKPRGKRGTRAVANRARRVSTRDS